MKSTTVHILTGLFVSFFSILARIFQSLSLWYSESVWHLTLCLYLATITVISKKVRQEQSRLDVLKRLNENTVLVVNDWAMKFLPQLYRESQQDWFGKRGISWHISVVFRRVRGELQSQGFVHIIQQCNQDSTCIILIMQHVLKTLKAEHPEITTAFYRQDNAGCYHCANTILACPVIGKSTGIQVSRLDFSDPQGGKGPADRLAATCKSHIRIYINEGHNVTKAEEMQEALLSHGGVNGVRVAV